ncbi:PLP-dependent aminotransferase family protein [Agrobacterium larrymoorei]|uniref:aminotransferase-like domain-containing protein n=1 Tax=Agrobacterium larrymoorei TaxID=160699 RepID=UPI001572C1E3|nr:PLP-dependent aminotransferase family protein [Agrobacterium larrymoorei]NTJ42225.1 PLP-dependent aminotransferase family protein [Agrobacterium larrymoorei]
MTNWLPDLTKGSGPIYLRLAEHIENAIASGTLAAGTKLPPQRNLAFDLGVTIGTISRAYSLIHERGLVSGEVGRGTYVNERRTLTPKPKDVDGPFGGTRVGIEADAGHIMLNGTAAPNIGQQSIINSHISDIMQEHPNEITDYTRGFPTSWTDAGVKWLSHGDWSPKPEGVVATLGAHAAVLSVISAMTAPGDRIVFEPVTYSQVSRAAVLTGRRISLVEIDEHGIVPDDFERVCAQQHPKLIFLMSSAQNPTCATLPLERRKAIADIARRYNVWIVEDNLYGAMRNDGIPLIVELAPDQTFLVGGLSKSVGAGLRGGWVACPPHFVARVRVAHKMLTGGVPFLMAELSARLVNSGDAYDIHKDCIAEIRAREAIVQATFDGLDFNSAPEIAFAWVKLPEPWLSGTFRSAAMKEKVFIDDEDEFKPARTDRIFHRVRVSFSLPRTHAELQQGLNILRRLLDNGTAGYDSLE